MTDNIGGDNNHVGIVHKIEALVEAFKEVRE